MSLRRDLSKKVEEGTPPSLEKYTTFATIQDKYHKEMKRPLTHQITHKAIHPLNIHSLRSIHKITPS
jgi:bacillopeptidase F (M6 metalloprotease family)